MKKCTVFYEKVFRTWKRNNKIPLLTEQGDLFLKEDARTVSLARCFREDGGKDKNIMSCLQGNYSIEK